MAADGPGRQKTAAYATGEVHDSSGATAATPTRTRRDGGIAAVSSTVSQEGQSRQEDESAVSPEDCPVAVYAEFVDSECSLLRGL